MTMSCSCRRACSMPRAGDGDRVADAVAAAPGREDLARRPARRPSAAGDGVGRCRSEATSSGRVPLALEPAGELAGQGRLAGALQAGQHDHGRRVLGELQPPGLAAEDADQLLVDDLDDLLAGFSAPETSRPGPLLDRAMNAPPAARRPPRAARCGSPAVASMSAWQSALAAQVGTAASRSERVSNTTEPAERWPSRDAPRRTPADGAAASAWRLPKVRVSSASPARAAPRSSSVTLRKPARAAAPEAGVRRDGAARVPGERGRRHDPAARALAAQRLAGFGVQPQQVRGAAGERGEQGDRGARRRRRSPAGARRRSGVADHAARTTRAGAAGAPAAGSAGRASPASRRARATRCSSESSTHQLRAAGQARRAASTCPRRASPRPGATCDRAGADAPGGADRAGPGTRADRSGRYAPARRAPAAPPTSEGQRPVRAFVPPVTVAA